MPGSSSRRSTGRFGSTTLPGSNRPSTIGLYQYLQNRLQRNKERRVTHSGGDQYRQVLVLYLERPLRDHAHLRDLRGALLIQRLEGSRPHGRLCTLNRSERVQGDQVPAELGRMCGFDVAMDR